MSNTDKPEGYVFGRPTVYRPEMCQQVIEWGRSGKSKAWMAANLEISKQTMFRWENENPHFRDALSRAVTLSQAHWEDLGQTNMVVAQGQTFSQNAYGRSMAARFPDDWREKVGHVGGSKDDEPIKQETTHIALDEFGRRIAGMSARVGAAAGDGETEPSGT